MNKPDSAGMQGDPTKSRQVYPLSKGVLYIITFLRQVNNGGLNTALGGAIWVSALINIIGEDGKEPGD